MIRKKRKTISQEIKNKARRSLSKKVNLSARAYVIDTNVAVNENIRKLVRRGLKGRIIIPNAVMAELENLANKGVEAGFIGLEEVSRLHQLKKRFNFSIQFQGPRPNEHQIRFAKSGEIDAMIRQTAVRNKAVLVTSDLVQAKTSQAYNIPVIFLSPKIKEEKKKPFFFFNNKKHKR